MREPDAPERNSHEDLDVNSALFRTPFITRKEAADLLRVAPATIDTYYKRGVINKYKVAYGKMEGRGSGKCLFKREEILALVVQLPPASLPEKVAWKGEGLAEDPRLVDARSVDQVRRDALKRYDEERGRR